jgi:ABC-type Mn2+/Zn2+ transport system permease subunit
VLALLLDPLGYVFMQRALLATTLVGVLCAIVGTYVVLRGMAFIGDALAHAVLPGVAAAFLLGADLFVGALIAGILTALGIGFITRTGRVREDTAIGILFTGALALGVVLISTAKTYATDLTHILFGNVLGVSPGDLWLTVALGGLVLAILLALHKEFLIVAFDPVLAASLRVPVGALRYLLLVLLAISVVVSLQTVGVVLVAGLLVTPAATAYQFTRRLPAMMLAAAALGALAGIVGLYLSFYLNVASGAAIVLVSTACFLLVLLGRSLRRAPP